MGFTDVNLSRVDRNTMYRTKRITAAYNTYFQIFFMLSFTPTKFHESRSCHLNMKIVIIGTECLYNFIPIPFENRADFICRCPCICKSRTNLEYTGFNLLI